MNGLQEMVLISEIVLQAKIAKRAAERLQATQNSSDKVEVWSSIQSLLAATGMVSKILWPLKKYQTRGKHLRKILKVEETNILSSRKFRNHFEHYDERIDDLFSERPSSVYIDLAMNPSLRGIAGFPMFTHRGYNTFNNTLEFRGESLDLGEVMASLNRILENCRPYALV